MDAYLRFWGLVCYAVTAWLLFVKEVCVMNVLLISLLNPLPQDKEKLDVNEMGLKRVYLTIWDICKLKRESLSGSHVGPRFTIQFSRRTIPSRVAFPCQNRVSGE